MKTCSEQIAQGNRFEFGANWEAFLSSINEERIIEAEKSLKQMLELDDLVGKKFLDIGSGSGLFSLAAKRLGAEVYSFDYDYKSVRCTKELKRRYCPNDNSWIIEQGSVLDEDYLRSLGKFDFVYSWGVLHHTGNMIKALRNIIIPVSEKGCLYIAIYNDQGIISDLWRKVKKTFSANWFNKFIICLIFMPVFVIQTIAASLVKYRSPFVYFLEYKRRRGMSIYYDWIDWLGGFPFEVAKPEMIILFYKNTGFVLNNISTTNKKGCNQFVFKKL